MFGSNYFGFGSKNNGGSSTTSYVETTLSAQPNSVKTLYSAPLEVVAAPGAGKFIRVNSAILKFTYGSIPYNFGVGSLVLRNASSSIQYLSDISRINAAENVFTTFVIYQAILSYTANEALILTVDSGANATTGNSPIKIYVNYSIIDV